MLPEAGHESYSQKKGWFQAGARVFGGRVQGSYQADSRPSVDQEIPHWFKVTFLRWAETAIKSWFVVLGACYFSQYSTLQSQYSYVLTEEDDDSVPGPDYNGPERFLMRLRRQTTWT